MTWEEQVFARYYGKGVLLDSNLLLLLLIGSYERERIALFKRTSDFSPEQCDFLVQLLEKFSRVVTTPHVLTEVGNLASHLPEHIRLPSGAHFAKVIPTLDEVFQAGRTLALEDCFARFGLTDTAIRRVAADTLVLTEDYRLSGYLRSRELPVLHFKDLAAIRGILR